MAAMMFVLKKFNNDCVHLWKIIYGKMTEFTKGLDT